MGAKSEGLLIVLQRLLPQHILSRLAGRLTEARTPWFKNFLIRLSIRHFHIDLSDALETDPEKYDCFNDFFTRALRADARPIDAEPNSAVSPADGVLSQAGTIDGEQMIQAKGRNFAIASLLNSPPEHAQSFLNGMFATIYLSPKDYHRVHMPLAGTLRTSQYVPGSLFSVNEISARHIDQLFTRNERLVCWFDTEVGDMALILVGAMLVAGIETVWHGHYAAGIDTHETFDLPGAPSSAHHQFAKGEEIGRFKFGSTVIMLLPAGARLADRVATGQPIDMGSALASLPPKQLHTTADKPGQH